MMVDGGEMLFVRTIPAVSPSSDARIMSLLSPLVMTSFFVLPKLGCLRAASADMAPTKMFLATVERPTSPAMTLAKRHSDRNPTDGCVNSTA